MCTLYCTLDRQRFGMRMDGMLALSASCVFPLRLLASLPRTLASHLFIPSVCIAKECTRWCRMIQTSAETGQWPWLYFNVTAVSNNLTEKFFVLIWLSWNFVQLLIMSSKLWIYHYFLLLRMFKRELTYFLVWKKKLTLPLFWTLLKRDLSNFAWL